MRLRRYKSGKTSIIIAVLKMATGRSTLKKASLQTIGRPRKVKKSRARPLKSKLKGKVKLSGNTMLLPKTRPWERLAAKATSNVVSVNTPKGAPEAKSRHSPPIKAQTSPSLRPRKMIQPMIRIKTKSG